MKKRRVKFIQKEDGDIVTLPTDGRPFLFACCGSEEGGCDLVHSLYTSVDSNGKVSMQVFREDEYTEQLRSDSRRERAHDDALFTSDVVIDRDTGRVIFQVIGDASSEAAENFRLFNDSSAPAQKDHTMRTEDRRRQRQLDALNADCFDENGVMRDGAHYRVPLHLRDAQPPTRSGRRAVRDVVADADTAAARIAEAVRVTEAVLATQAASGVNEMFTDTELARHRPGFRFADGSTTTEEEHHVTHRRRKTVYRDPLGREQGSSETDDALSPGEVARRQRIADTEAAWKNYAPGYSNKPGENAVGRALEMLPPRGGYYPASAGVGASCTIDGAAGTLQPADNGMLYCRPSPPIGATRADAAPPRTMSAADAERIKGEAYNTMVSELTSAWRS